MLQNLNAELNEWLSRMVHRNEAETESGQGMVEYGLLIALIAIAAIAVITLVGTGLGNNFQTVLNAL